MADIDDPRPESSKPCASGLINSGLERAIAGDDDLFFAPRVHLAADGQTDGVDSFLREGFADQASDVGTSKNAHGSSLVSLLNGVNPDILETFTLTCLRLLHGIDTGWHSPREAFGQA